MPVHLPVQIFRCGFVHRCRSGGEISGNVVFKAVLADISEQFLHLRYFHHTCSAKGMQWIVREGSLADITGYMSSKIIGGEARKAHRPCLYCAVQRAMRVFLANSAGDD